MRGRPQSTKDQSETEREELVVFTHADSEASITSFDKRVWRVCDRKGGRIVRRHIRKGKEEGRDYAVPLGTLWAVLNLLGEIAKEKAAKNKAEIPGPAQETALAS